MGEEEDADRELAECLARARRAAQQRAAANAGAGSLDEIAAAAAKKREEDEAKIKEEIKSGVLVLFAGIGVHCADR